MSERGGSLSYFLRSNKSLIGEYKNNFLIESILVEEKTEDIIDF